MKIAVIGSGISGLSSAYYLSKKFKVDLYEKENYFGGHSYTYNIKKNKKVIPVDLGFIVFNKLTYPNLIDFFEELGVPYEKSNMSFAVSVQDKDLEYGGSGINALFADKKNIFNLEFLNMIKEIIQFYRSAPKLLKENLVDETLGNYLKRSKLSKYFIQYHIIPMVAAIWSMPFEKAMNLPFELFLKFFSNHGLFKLKKRPQWYTVTGRSKNYVDKVLNRISGEIYKNYDVKQIERSENNVRIKIGNEYLDYDHVVLATHADQSLNMLSDCTEDEKKILGNFQYVSNFAVLHTDSNLMPKRKSTWSSWNSITNHGKTCITYWLNKLQNLKCKENFFLTLNPILPIDQKTIIKKVNFTHPYFNSETVNNQKNLDLLQGKKRTWYCGSYFGYGFHEDGIKSTINFLDKFKL